jgi:hypothetical protein
MWMRGDHLPPPFERLCCYDSRRIAAQIATANRLRRFVDITHQQEQNVADRERVTLPGPLDLIATLGAVHSGDIAVFPGRVDPLAPPPGLRLRQPAAIVIATDVVDVLAAVTLHCAQLPHDLFPLGIIRHLLPSRHVANIDGDIPCERWATGFTSSFGRAQRVGQAVPIMFDVGTDVSVSKGPQAEAIRHEMSDDSTVHVCGTGCRHVPGRGRRVCVQLL